MNIAFQEELASPFNLNWRRLKSLVGSYLDGPFVADPKLQHVDLTLSPLINEPYAKRIRLYLRFTKTKLQQKKIKNTELINANWKLAKNH